MHPALSSGRAKRRVAALVASAAIGALAAVPALGADVGPGPDSVTIHSHGYLVKARITPNSSGRWNDIDLAVSRRGSPLRHAAVSVRFEMPAMSMGDPRFKMREGRPGVYRYSGPAMSMGGLWVLTFHVRPHGGGAFAVVVRDHVRG